MTDHFYFPFEKSGSYVGTQSFEVTGDASLFHRLTAFERYQLSFHPERPKFRDYLPLFQDVEECHKTSEFGGQLLQTYRATFATDEGLRIPVMLVGQQSGPTSNYAELREHLKNRDQMKAWNHGMPTPAAYQRAIDAIATACAESRIVITVIDTPGADPTEESEAGGIAWKIGGCMKALAEATVPTLSLIINRGCSGGAIALTGCDVVLALEYSTYLVIAPEACSSILFRTRDRADEAARISRITSREGFEFGIVDDLIPEPEGPAHRYPQAAREKTREYLSRWLTKLATVPTTEVFDRRVSRWDAIGRYAELSEGEVAEIRQPVSRLPKAESEGFVHRHEDCYDDDGNHFYDPVSIRQLRAQNYACDVCGYRYARPSAWDYIDAILDAKSFTEHEETRHIGDLDLLGFPGYAGKLRETRRVTGLASAMITGNGAIGGRDVVFCATDFGFFGGSFSMSTGEKIWRAAEIAIRRHVPLVLQASGGGARMHEGCSSMVSIPKVHVALSRVERAGLPLVTITTDPTLGGVAIGYACRGTRIFETNAGNIGFSGRRVIEQYTGHRTAKDFQTTAWLKRLGFVERTAPLHGLADEIGRALSGRK